MATSTIKGLKVEKRSFVLSGVNSTYAESTTDMTLDGYTPIALCWKSNQVNTIIYRADIDGNNIIIGRYLSSGLNSNTLTITVIYVAL